MSLLDTIEKPQDGAPIITLLGDAGRGKTSTACALPNPIVIRAEDGLKAIPEAQRPQAFPLVKKVDDLWEQLKTLVKEEHNFKTLVIDSVTSLEQMFIQHVIDSDEKNPNSINQAQGGFGNGTSAVASMHHRVRKACGVLNENKGMSIVFVAHADTETLDLPDKDAYMRYNLRLGKKSSAPYTDNVDLVGFLEFQTYLHGDKDQRTKKAKSDGTLTMNCKASASSCSKNRYGIDNAIIVEPGKNPFINYIHFFGGAK